jgi:uncharacterized protein YjdB
LPANAKYKGVTFSSSDENVAIVDSSGQVRGVGGGYAVITVTTLDGEHAAQSQITVDLPVLQITLEPKTPASLNVGDEYQYTWTIEPADATIQDVTFSSSDESVLTVENDGVHQGTIKGISTGKATVTIQTDDAGCGTSACTSSQEIEVYPLVEGVNLTPEYTVLRLGTAQASVQLEAEVLPEGAPDKSVTYYSNNSDIASVDESGLVQVGTMTGETDIIVTTNSGNFQDTAKIKVEQPVTGFSVMPIQIELGLNRVSRIVPLIAPFNATDKSVIWESEDPSIATVDANGVVKGISKGQTDIIGKTLDGNFEARSHITVLSSVTGVNLFPPSASLKVGERLQMSADVLPQDAPNKKVKYKTSDARVAVVTADGLVEVISPGSAIITVSTLDGYYEDTSQILVFKVLNY